MEKHSDSSEEFQDCIEVPQEEVKDVPPAADELQPKDVSWRFANVADGENSKNQVRRN
jgi:hypothetical protein